jgi:UBX domain-containing protein 1/4
VHQNAATSPEIVVGGDYSQHNIYFIVIRRNGVQYKGMSAMDSDDEAMQAALQLSLGEHAGVSPHDEQQAQSAADHLEAEHELSAQQTLDDEEMVPVPVNDSLLAQLMDMGFTDVRGRKGLVHGGGDLGNALTWLSDHEQDADIDQPYLVRKADAQPKAPLSEAEKAKKLEELKSRIQARRAEKALVEKQEEIKREKDRRERGQKMDETIEERQRLMRKREAERLKREKDVRDVVS